MSVTFSVIIPTIGRETLLDTLSSVALQLENGDEVIVGRNLDPPHGHAKVRNSAMKRAAGTHLLFMDDDDVYTENALYTIRKAVAQQPTRIHIFKMQYMDGHTLWAHPEVEYANIGTPMLCIPNDERKGSWSEAYGSDYDFLQTTLMNHDQSPVFHADIVALIRPKE